MERLEPSLLPHAVPVVEAEIATLRVLDGIRAGRVYVLNQRDMLVGSDEDCAVRLLDEGVMPRHALVHCGRTPPVVADLTGSGLTRVNGRPVADAALRDGDIVFCGPRVVMRFELRGVVRRGSHAGSSLAPEIAARLDPRERLVAELVVEGARPEAIAERTDLALDVVDAIVAALHERWSAPDRATLIAALIRSPR